MNPREKRLRATNGSSFGDNRLARIRSKITLGSVTPFSFRAMHAIVWGTQRGAWHDHILILSGYGFFKCAYAETRCGQIGS